MSTALRHSIQIDKSESPGRSLIKPHLLNLSGSGTTLNGMIVERNLEQPNADIDSTSNGASKHVIVLHSSDPARLEWRIDGKQKEAGFTNGDAIINPFGLYVAPRWNSEVEIILLAINPTLVDQIAEQMDVSNKVELIPNFKFQDGLLQQLVHNLISEFENGLPSNQADLVYLESLTHTLISHLIRRYTVEEVKQISKTRGLPPRKLARVMDYINDNLDKTLSLQAIAKVVDISPSYFNALFRESTGKPPHKYIIDQRIEEAKRLLIQTSKPIAEIAYQTGFADQSHLTRLMRRHTGLTPNTIRSG